MIVTDALYSDPDLGPLLRELPAVTPLTRDVFDGASAERRLCDYFAVATMDGLAAMSRLEATAAAAAVTYIDRTQVGKRPPLSPPSREAAGTTMAIDPATRANLELTRRSPANGAARCSMRSTAPSPPPDRGCWRTVWPRRSPTAADHAAARRHRALRRRHCCARRMRATLNAAPDMSRALTRLSLGRGGPRDLAALRDGILAADQALARLPTGSAAGGALRGVDALRRPSRDLARESSARWPNNCR